jgi:tetratricopeptide (TPR) repeat protein
VNWLKTMNRLINQISETDAQVAEFENAGPASSQPSLAFMNLGKQQASQGELEKALHNFEQAAEIDPNNADVFANWGITLAKVRRLEDALSKFARASELQPERAIHYVLWGACLVELGRLDEATLCYENAIGLKPNHVEPWLNWAISLSRLGLFEEALPKVQRVLQLNPSHAQGFYLWGSILTEQGNLGLAEEKFRFCLKYDTKHAEALHMLGVLQYRQGQFEAAMPYFEQTIQLNPHKPETYHTWGDCLHAVGRYAEAQACYDQATDLNPRQAEVWLSMARLQYDTGNSEIAIELFEKVEKLNPNTLGLHSLWALTLLETGDATAALEALARHTPTTPDANWYLAQTIGHARLNKVAQAQEFATKGLAQFPTESALLQAQGALHVQGLRFADAYRYFSEASRYRKHFHQADINMGLMLMHTGAKGEALHHFRALYRQYSNEFPYALGYALALLANDHPKDAKEKLRLLIDTYPTEARGLSAYLLCLLLQPTPVLEEAKAFLMEIDQTAPTEALGSHWIYVAARAMEAMGEHPQATQLWHHLQQHTPGLNHVAVEHANTVEPWRLWAFHI